MAFWAPYVPQAQRRTAAARLMLERKRAGDPLDPVRVDGRAIARRPWGQAWCANIERYQDFANRLPRGRTYLRNGSVIDLRITAGRIGALVSGSDVYRVTVAIERLSPAAWKRLRADCGGAVGSLVELLAGRLDQRVMERMCRGDTGLFPGPREIDFDCSCPDGANLCKHVAAVLYGVGARLDRQPELLFTLRTVDAAELIAQAGAGLAAAAPASSRALAGDVSALFGIELEPTRTRKPASPAVRNPPRKAVRARRDPTELLLERLRSGPLANADARAATGLDAIRVRALLQGLVERGLVRVEGAKRGTRYVAC